MDNIKAAVAKFDQHRKSDREAIDHLCQSMKQESGKHEEMPQEDEEALFKGLFHYLKNRGYKVAKPKKVANAAKTWINKDHSKYIRPVSLRGLANAVVDAEALGKKVKGIGSKHSFSDVILTEGWYIDMKEAHDYNMRRHNNTIEKLNQKSIELLKESVSKDYHMDVPAGMTIEELNHVLCPSKKKHILRFGEKRLFNMGGGDVQQFCGAFSTGTHGSGGKVAAYHDMVRSILIVSGGGKTYRVEPKRGITSKRKHAAYYKSRPDAVQVELIQDNDKFNSLLVSMGCFGVMYSAIIEVTDMEKMIEECSYEEQGWTEDIKAKFNDDILKGFRQKEAYYYLGINPYKVGENEFHSISKKVIQKRTTQPEAGKARRRKIWPRVFAKFNTPTWIVRTISNSGKFPKRRLIESGLKANDDNAWSGGKGFIDLAYKVWNTGIGKLINIGTAIEFAFPVDEAPAVLDQLFEFLDSVGDRGQGFYLNSPISIRFVPASKAYLAPNFRFHKGKQVNIWCYIEIARINSMNKKDDERELALYEDLQQKMLFLGGRPHWGLNFQFPFTPAILKDLYPNFDIWLETCAFFDPKGTFENKFTKAFVKRKKRAELA